ncbi:MAG: lactate racemase domain-containing protein [Anaerolineae bacterium]
MRISIPWQAWYGDEDLTLTFPDDWKAKAYWPHDAPDLDEEAIEAAFDDPIGTAPIEKLVREKVAEGKRTVAIAVDDISRATPARRLLPELMRRLEMGGVDLDDVRVVLGVGMHRLMTKEEMVKKLGEAVVDRLDVYNSYPHGNLTDYGVSERGTPIKVSSHFAEADIKIGVGSIAPHGGPGFGGGAKVVIPGVASFETVAAMHKPGRLKTGLLNVDHNELRADIEDMVGKVGLDAIINVVLTSRRGIAGAFVGHFIEAHRAAVALAKKVYATEMPEAPVDIAICSAYPKDTDFLQSGLALNVLSTAALVEGSPFVVKEDGTVVVVTASPEGRGHHALYSPGMVYGRREGDWRLAGPDYQGRPIAYFSPHITPQDARNLDTFRAWEEVVAYLGKRHDCPKVAVFPCGALQIAANALA